MASGGFNGMSSSSSSRRTKGTPSHLDINNVSLGVAVNTPASLNEAASRRPHDSLLDSNPSRPSSSLRSPFITDSHGHQRLQETSFWLDEDTVENDIYHHGRLTPASPLPPPRKESLQHLSAAKSPLARAVDEDYLAASGSPPRKLSTGVQSNTSQEQWWRPESRPGSAQPSPGFARALELRGSAASPLPSPGLAGVSNSRLRGMTASSELWPTLHHSASYGDLRMSNRTLPTNVYRPSRNPDAIRDSAQSSLRKEHFIPPFAAEARASVRSAWTAHSSGFLGSDRSSVMTQESLMSDTNRVEQRIDDLLLSVEDAINMYSQGFADDYLDQAPREGVADEVDSWREPASISLSHEATMLQHSATLDDRFPVVERTPVPVRSSSDPKINTPTKPVSYQASRHPKSPPQDSYITDHSSAPVYELSADTEMGSNARVLQSAENSSQSTFLQTSGPSAAQYHQFDHPLLSPSYSDPRAGSHTSSHELLPSFSASPARTPRSPSQPPTPRRNDDVFTPEPVQKTSPQPFEQADQPRAYLPLRASSDLPEHYSPDDTQPSSTRPWSPLPNPPPVARDRYGFKKVTQYITEEQYDEWDSTYSTYLDRRRLKWRLLMKQYGLSTEDPIRFPPRTEKVKRYIRKGIPPEWRGAAWFWYAGGPGRLIQNLGLYWSLVDQVQRGKLSDADREHIERDLNRTFPDHVKFKPDANPQDGPTDPANSKTGSSKDTSVIRALRRVLQAFALHNPSIGYCQSLNFLAGLLLLFLDEDEEKAFIMLDVITSEHFPGTHAKVLEANVDIGVLMMCIKESMPAVWAKIDDNAEEMMDPKNSANHSISRLPTVSLATTAWFMSCFIGNLPIECVLRVWDIFFYEGSKTLFRIALTIFKLGEPEIRGINEHMEVFQLVQTIPRRLIDANILMEACYKKRNGFQYLSQDTVDQRRIERRKILAEERSRKKGMSSAKRPDREVDMAEEESRSRSGVTNGLKRAASRARMKRSQSRRRPPTARA